MYPQCSKQDCKAGENKKSGSDEEMEAGKDPGLAKEVVANA